VKFDISVNQIIKDKQQELAEFVVTERLIWVVASTHKGDESIALNAFAELLKSLPQLLLIIVPRHPERFNDVASLCVAQGYNIARRSTQEKVTRDKQVWLLDSLGELLPTCALASVVTMGGSFSDIGGHNPLEPALFKKPIVVGPNMSNFVEVMQQLVAEKGIIELTDQDNAKMTDELSKVIADILLSEKTQQTLGENAYRVVTQNQGASARSVKQLLTLL
jgi:3-deoxy-D-manno-octulosonic-acid transferase